MLLTDNSPKLTYRFSAISIKIVAAFLAEIDKLSIKLIWKCLVPRIAKTILTVNKNRRVYFLISKLNISCSNVCGIELRTETLKIGNLACQQKNFWQRSREVAPWCFLLLYACGCLRGTEFVYRILAAVDTGKWSF